MNQGMNPGPKNHIFNCWTRWSYRSFQPYMILKFLIIHRPFRVSGYMSLRCSKWSHQNVIASVEKKINWPWVLCRLVPAMCSSRTYENRSWRDMKWKELMMLICAGSKAAKWSAIQEAAHFWRVLGKKTEILAEQRAQVASSLKQREKRSDRLFMPFEFYCFVKKRAFHTKKRVVWEKQEPTEAASEWVTQLYLLKPNTSFSDKCDMVTIKITGGWHSKEIQYNNYHKTTSY